MTNSRIFCGRTRKVSTIITINITSDYYYNYYGVTWWLDRIFCGRTRSHLAKFYESLHLLTDWEFVLGIQIIATTATERNMPGKIKKKIRHICTSDFERVYLESCLWVGKSWTMSNYYCVPLLQPTIANLCLSSQVKLQIESIIDQPPAARRWCACIFIELNDAANHRKISQRW